MNMLKIGMKRVDCTKKKFVFMYEVYIFFSLTGGEGLLTIWLRLYVSINLVELMVYKVLMISKEYNYIIIQFTYYNRKFNRLKLIS